MSQHLAQVDDVVVEVEGSERQGNNPRIGPVGNVDVVMGQERFNRAAKQRCVMARHWRHDQKLWLIDAVLKVRSGETKEVAERPRPHNLLENRIDGPVDGKVVEPKGGLAVAACQTLEKLGAGRDVLAER